MLKQLLLSNLVGLGLYYYSMQSSRRAKNNQSLTLSKASYVIDVGDQVLTSSRGGMSSTLKASRSPEVLWYVGLPHSSTCTLTGSMMDSAVSCSLPSRHENT